MKELKIDTKELNSRLSALQISQEEIKILSKILDEYDRIKERVEPLFMEVLENRLPSGQYELLEPKIEKILDTYFLEMLKGSYDLSYAQNRVEIGYLFYHASITPHLFVAAFSSWYTALLKAAAPMLGDETLQASIALNKLLLFDTSLFMETYFHEDKNRFRRLFQKYSTIIDSMRDGVVVIDADSLEIVEVNRCIEHMSGKNRKELLGKSLFTLHPPEFGKLIEKEISRTKSEHSGLIPEIYIVNEESGEYQPVEATYARFDLDEESYIVKIVRDIKDRLSIQKKLVRLNRLYRVLSAVNELIIRSHNKKSLYKEICRIIVEEGGFKFAWIAEVDEESRINPVAYFETALFYKNIEHKLKKSEGADISEVVKKLKSEGHITTTETKEGKFQHEKLTIPIYHEREHVGIPIHSGEELRAILKIFSGEESAFSPEEIRLFKEIASDISFAITTIENRERLKFLTNFDLLTRLPNRHLFKERLDMAVYSGNFQKEAFAVVLVDIDNLKQINETFGFGFGDKVIKETAEYLKRLIRPQDLLSRYDSDEFALIFFDIRSEEEILSLVKDINRISRIPITIDEEELYITFSIGTALFPKDAYGCDDLQSAAQAALNRAKKQGGNTFIFYSESINNTIQSKVRLQNELTKALHNGEFELYYQPQVDLNSMQITGAEALIRWHHPSRGLVSPAEFIPTLEESYLIEAVGQWVIEEACRQIQEWQKRDIRISVTVAINISTKQITRNADFFDTLLQTVDRSGIDPSLLRVEITESLIMENLETVQSGLERLRAKGILSAIDDFGTGYSSLLYLKKLPVYALKIDRAFIKNLPDDEEDAAITEAIISLGKNLGKRTIAEGVETKEQIEFLKSAGCDTIQGYILARPMPADEFESYYRARDKTL